MQTAQIIVSKPLANGARHTFFKQAVLNQDFGQRLFELPGLSLEILDLVRGRLPRRVAGEPLLACLQELLRPTIIKVLVDPLLAAEFGNADLAALTFQIFSSAE